MVEKKTVKKAAAPKAAATEKKAAPKKAAAKKVDLVINAETVGFKKVETLDEGMYSIIYTNVFINWKDIRNKQDFNEEEFDKVIKMINEEK